MEGERGGWVGGLELDAGVIFLLGPTAAGKSRVAMTLAQEVGAEIVSVDAMQIYRGLDIGTGKAKKADLEKIPHHLLDLIEPEDAFSAADYAKEAGKVLLDLEQRSARSLWVGGTGFYHRAVTEGLAAAPATDPAVAARYELLATEEMGRRVQEADPLWAKKGDLQNRRRMIRVLAIGEQTGRRMSDWQEKETKRGVMAGVETWCLRPAMETLEGVIRVRVEKMLRGGWGEEVKRLRERSGWAGCPGSRAIGYEEVAAMVDGVLGEKEACDKIVAATRAYAKRQLTWFREIPKVKFIEIDPREPLPKVGVQTLVRALEASEISR